jgi:hypothetical protein
MVIDNGRLDEPLTTVGTLFTDDPSSRINFIDP